MKIVILVILIISAIYCIVKAGKYKIEINKLEKMSAKSNKQRTNDIKYAKEEVRESWSSEFRQRKDMVRYDSEIETSIILQKNLTGSTTNLKSRIKSYTKDRNHLINAINKRLIDNPVTYTEEDQSICDILTGNMPLRKYYIYSKNNLNN